jgi:hypothetical protein
MSAAVKISDTEMDAIREAAALQSRSMSGQAEHWLRLGRAFERDPRFGYAKVEQALKGLVAPMDLNEDEQEQYFDRMDSLLSAPSAEADAFFKDMRERTGGVGMDDEGNIINYKPTNAGSL